ncbi:MAG: hypothetical protein GY771_04930, partial [bacterium]|nr:hypothetical protein [bacterium]
MEVIRNRLIDRLAGERVTVIKAPSGFGKSTLIRQFQTQYPEIITCGISVRHLDKYPGHFLRRFVAKLREKLGEDYFVRSNALVEEGSENVVDFVIAECFECGLNDDLPGMNIAECGGIPASVGAKTVGLDYDFGWN